jgi:hypothetical protein
VTVGCTEKGLLISKSLHAPSLVIPVTMRTRLITGYVLIQDMIAQGITVLPVNERVARELAKYPKNDRKEI